MEQSRDIENREDINHLVNRFYEKVRANPIIGFIFNDLRPIDWDKHTELVTDFWENALFFTGSYGGNPLQTHSNINRAVPLEPAYFNEWLRLFTETVDAYFSGPKAELAKQRAHSIATVMRIKIVEGRPPIGSPTNNREP